MAVAAIMAALPAHAELGEAQILHLLNRAGFGPTQAAVAHVKAIGIDGYIDEQLHPETIALPAALAARLGALDTLRLGAAELFTEYGPPQAEMDGTSKPSQAEIDARIKRAGRILAQAQAARVWRALDSPRQLEEAMVDFWFNHFNVYAYAGFDSLWVGSYEEEAIRPHVLGQFRDLLIATARHPAMLYYLDSQNNTMPGIPGAGPGFAGLNENYARELMELHTLGADGGYTQADVVALAHVLTGWGFDYKSLKSGTGSVFGFDAWRHDPAEIIFLGHRIPAGGEEQGVAALDILASSPATAHHIAFELAQYFVADEPPPALVERLAQRFLDSRGDIAAVMKTLLTSPDFAASAGQKYKTPFQYVLSAARAAGVEPRSPTPLLGTMAQLGMPLYLCPTPDGYKNTEEAWLSPGATVQRANFAVLVGNGALQAYVPPDETPAAQLVSAPAPDAAALAHLLGPVLTDHTRAAIAESPPALRAALILGSPDFMRK
jgi:uncharacterized protein (DUF1800 family)